ncbi:Methyltransferase type 11 OS=Pedosphaera parvula (strain Ellin514) GN=Cflav_PD3075 PE=4 SV=1: Methyltransf_31 [Gemmata massiliana]|uniref:Methyltransferase domain-containing protein n=1 Tax=Gemmata massiliana TaxID=1210884 RepID=A0A6P2DKD1_9BACT|nr:class I SAM-dependent methyltransferase [Gemmata massiliana]VTS02007.1 Methyltransferase type 11 OS=Pedosphaera parvula (strain Ellin514) GN=Cflav_PD3075 PE=4 SV=1: Methyltransf_31 [Gemmata massiliana]
MKRVLAVGVVVALACGWGTALGAEDPPKAAPKREKPKYEYREEHDRDGIGKFYMGREIAHVMGYGAAGWLERKERIKEEDPEKLIKSLEIKEGMVVADVGAGSGYHTFMIAPLVGEKGKVIASDIQQEMLDLVTAKAKKQKVTNIETVKGTATDPKLPAGKVDLILMVDVYHEFEHPFEMAEKLVEALKPGGRLVFVEFRLEDDKVAIKLVHKMSERQVLKEMTPFPEMTHTKTVGTLPWQHVVIFTKKEPKK